MHKLLLIDGHNLLFKAFFGVPEQLLSSGFPVQGITGFIGMTVRIIRNVGPSHVLVVFDPEETPSARNPTRNTSQIVKITAACLIKKTLSPSSPV